MTALAIPADVKPLAVWDTRTVDNPWWYYWRSANEWAHENIPDSDRTYRVEFYLLDGPFVVVCRYALDGNGSKYLDPGTGTAAVDPPVTVPLAELPPARLLRQEGERA